MENLTTRSWPYGAIALYTGIAFLAAACGGAEEGPISITRMDTHVLEDGEIEVEAPFADGELLAWGPDEVTGELVPLTVEVSGATATIPDAPAGEVTIELTGGGARELIVTSRRSVDLGRRRLGRPDVVIDATGPMPIDLTNLQPWRNMTDEIHLYVPGAGMYLPTLRFSTAFSLAEGDTFAEHSTPFLTGPQPRVDAGAGDVSYVYQLSPVTTSGGIELLTPVRASTSDQFSSEGTLAVALTAPAAAEIEIDWSIAAFHRELEAAHPGAALIFHRVGVMAGPGPASYGFFAATADLALNGEVLEHEDRTETILFGDPFPASWTRVVTLTSFARHDHGPAAILAPYWSFVPVDSAGGSQGPRIGAPRNLRVDGLATSGDITIEAPSLIEWDPPATGTARVYRVSLHSTDELRVPFTRIVTRGTEVRIPPGTLRPGSSFVALVAAVDSGANIDRSPLHVAYPEHGATAATGLVTVGGR